MIYFKLRYKVLGGHTHVRLFSSKNPDGTFGKNGDLIFRNDEWEQFLRDFQRAVVLPEEELAAQVKQKDAEEILRIIQERKQQNGIK